ncbi:MAG: hypothetical protein HY782_06880 [Chloroflexi bacterium]|nr:hypothetical protein [Chloroflexota bacterium]
MKANFFRIMLSLMLVLLMLARFVGVADAEQICGPDGRPAIHFVGGPPNRGVLILAIDQNGKTIEIKVTLDDKGNGIFPFGEPGVTYQKVGVFLDGQKEIAGLFQNVKCDLAKPTIESMLGDVTKNWGRLTDVITGWLTRWY